MSEIDTILKAVEENYGEGVVVCATDSLLRKDFDRIPTGIFSVDYATGGGIPIGVISRFIGKESSGKTALALKAVAGAQKLCRECLTPGKVIKGKKENEPILECPKCGKSKGFRVVWFDAEGVWSRKWSEKFGIVLPWTYVIRTEFAEQGIDTADALLRSGEFDLLVVDSIAHLTPMAEIEESTEKWQIGLAARLVNKALRKWVSAMTAAGSKGGIVPTMILINQIRYNIGGWGNPEVCPGGKGQDFASSLDLYLKQNKKEDTKGYLYEGDKTVAMHTHFAVSKSRVCPPKLEGTYKMWLADNVNGKTGDTDDVAVVFSYAKKYELLKKNGVEYELLGKKFKAQKDAREEMYANDAYFKEVREATLEVMYETTA